MLRFLSVLCTFLLLNTLSHAQVSESWSATLPGDLVFQKVTATGSHIASTSAGLLALDPETGKELWNDAEFANVTEAEISEISGSPLLMVDRGGQVAVVNPFDGSVPFHSAKAGVAELTFVKSMFRTNGLLVSGKTADGEPVMLLRDLGTGEERWRISEKFGKIIQASEISAEEMLVVAVLNIYRIKSQTGDVVWQASTSAESAAMKEAGAIGELFGALTEEIAANVDFNLRYYPHPDKGVDAFIIGSENKNHSQTSTAEKPAYVYSTAYSAYKKSDGSLIWPDPVTMSGRFGDLAYAGNDVIILPDDGNKTRINRIALSSGEGKWGKKGKGTNIKGGVNSHIMTDDGMIVVTTSGSTTFLDLINLADGESLYKKPTKLSGKVVRTIPSKGGLGILTTESFDILDIKSGELRLGKTIDTAPGLVDQSGSDLYVFDTKKGIVRKVNLNDASEAEITSGKLKLEGKDEPRSLEVRDNGILITGEQNLALFGMDGSTIFQVHYPAPRESGLNRALLMAQGIRAAYIGANAYAASGQLQQATAQVKEEDAVAGAVVEGLGTMYSDLGDAASDFAKKSFEQAKARFSATTQARDYMIVMAQVKKNENALLQVSKLDGQIMGQVDLGDDREPDYAVDDVSGKIFNATSDGKVVCYQL
jgi:outer membrane protein assembly factor BamB